MVEFLVPVSIGLAAGFVGGLLGVGGSIIIIPSLIFYLSYTTVGYSGSDQHLIQAAAMICNVFIAVPAVLVHLRVNAIMQPIVRRLVPAAMAGICIGVTVSNCSAFARENGKYLATAFAGFLCYVVGYNIYRLAIDRRPTATASTPQNASLWKVICIGLPMGFVAGLLGIGGGSLAVPAQQLLLRLPLRRAIANSATTIMFTAILGAAYKNCTLASHGISVAESVKLAAMLIPTAIVGSYLGGRLTHKLPRKALRVVFIVFMALVAWQTFSKALAV